MKPSCGVLMPCRGKLAHVEAAVSSILKQSQRDFEFLILDDEATPDVSNYLAGLNDSRIRIVRHDKALGVSQCLAKGVDLLETDLIFRMDSDDIAHPDRFKLQLAHMIRHPQIGVLGAQIRFLDSHSKPPWVPLNHSEIGYRMNWSNALNHPTIVFRRQVVLVASNYNASLECAQDYDLWMRLFFTTRLANLPDLLLQYRVHPAQNSNVRRASSALTRAEMRQRYRKSLTGFQVSPLFDEQDAWTSLVRPDCVEWQNWQLYLLRLRKVFRSGVHAGAFDPGSDLARRLWRSAKAYCSAGGVPAGYEQTLKKLSRWQSWLKGVF